MPARKHYVTNKTLVPEIIKSQEQGELTKEAIKMLISISERAIAKLRYKDPEDRRDCLAFAQMDLFKYGIDSIQTNLITLLHIILKSLRRVMLKVGINYIQKNIAVLSECLVVVKKEQVFTLYEHQK